MILLTALHSSKTDSSDHRMQEYPILVQSLDQKNDFEISPRVPAVNNDSGKFIVLIEDDVIDKKGIRKLIDKLIAEYTRNITNC